MAEQPQSSWVLRATSGPASGIAVPLIEGETFLGRVVQPGGIRLHDDSISRRHAIVAATVDSVTIQDAGSTNGTIVNGRLISQLVALDEGDRIVLGETAFVLIGQTSATTTIRRPPAAAEASTPAAPPTLPSTEEPPDGETALRTIMFTDLVGSTAMAQALGDARAIAVLGVHDQVVRRAIAENRGREVKHTGDGIMASFASAERGVKAAIDIMQDIEARRDADPTLQLQIRVGLNAGEPLSARGDLYGLAVSLAARLCDAAEPSTILVSDAVRMLCLGKEMEFIDRGTRELKGIQHPVTVCEVTWAIEDEPPPPPVSG